MPLRRQRANRQLRSWHLLLQEHLLIPHAQDSYKGCISSPDLSSLGCTEWNALFETGVVNGLPARWWLHVYWYCQWGFIFFLARLWSFEVRNHDEHSSLHRALYIECVQETFVKWMDEECPVHGRYLQHQAPGSPQEIFVRWTNKWMKGANHSFSWRFYLQDSSRSETRQYPSLFHC